MPCRLFAAVGLAFFLALAAAASADAVEPESPGAGIPAADNAAVEFFEKQVRPILAARCHECHGPKQQKGNLRLDARASILAGGDTGPAAVPGKPDESLLVDAIRYGETYQMPPKSQLPPGEIATLVEWVKRGLPWPAETKVAAGGPPQAFDLAERARHWCFQPLSETKIPAVVTSAWPTSAIDRFVLNRLEAAGIEPAAPADKRTLLRRVTFDLTGLPPAPEEIAAFLADNAPDAYAKLVERLLASPQYGERWGRHWLDLVRYAETQGHEFDYPIPNAYRYRDYVIRAFNADLPYDQFVIEHLAGDLIERPRINHDERINESILGTGFFFFGEAKHSPVDVRQDEADRIDNQIDVLAKCFLALTVSCARCHDHKFDAIGTKDYYALAGYLQSSRYQQAFIDLPEVFNAGISQLADLPLGEADLAERIGSALAELPDPALESLFDSVANEVELKIAAKDDAHPLHLYSLLQQAAAQGTDAFVRERDRLASETPGEGSATGLPAHAQWIVDCEREDWNHFFTTGQAFGDRWAEAGQTVFISEAETVRPRCITAAAAHSGLRSSRLQGVLRSATFTIEKPRIAYLLYGTGGRVRLVVDGLQLIQDPIYGGLQFAPRSPWPYWHLQDVSKWIGHRAYIEVVDDGDGYLALAKVAALDGQPVASPGRWAKTLLGGSSIDSLADLRNRHVALLAAALRSPTPFDRDEGTAAWRDLVVSRAPQWLAQLPDAPQLQMQWSALVDRRRQVESRLPTPRFAPALADGTGENERVFIRGNPKNLGEEVPRRGLEVLSGTQQPPPAAGSDRLELARRLIADSSALLARVIVNRVWKHHFGEGIVPTVDDFGRMGQPPRDRELLDYLAIEFIREGWSIKHLHRMMLLSSTYRMSSRGAEEAEARDPQNALVHRMPIRRLEAECIRDAMLAVSGRLDRSLFGESVPPHLTEFMSGRGRPEHSGPLDGNGRRSIYISVRRNFLTPMLLAFDYPTPFTTIGRRSVSNVPAQGLTLLNNPFVREQAELWARRMTRLSPTDDGTRIAAMYEMAFCRPPEPAELSAALRFVDDYAARHPGDEAWRAWAELAQVLFNVKEFIFVN